jgi:hypothetical protein
VRQTSTPLPASIPTCAPGHRPQWVETHGAPLRVGIGTPVPTTYHIECHRCGLATRPSDSRAITESRWTDPARAHFVPLSNLSQARAQAVSAIATAAHAA